MRLNRGRWLAVEGLLAATLITGAGLLYVAAAQGSTPAAQPKKAAATAPKALAKKAPVRRAARPRAQTAPTRERIVEIQQALAREGFYTAAPSGKWDAATTQAMTNFQTSKGLTPTGKLGALSLQKLGLGSETAGRGAPVPQADARPSALSESELNEPEPAEPPAN
jgi:peptidoglycan hydrolase-like protein with peptidoglycan-binding domain